MEDKNKTLDLILSIMQKDYDAEDVRNKNLETKVQIMLALSGIILSAIILLFKIVIESAQGHIIKNILLLFIVFALVFTIYSVYELLKAIKIKNFKKINHNALLSDVVMNMSELELKTNLIYDYNEAINNSIDVIKPKANSIKYSSNMLEVSVISIGLVLIIFVCNHFIKGDVMSDDKSSNNKSSNNSVSTTVKQQEINNKNGTRIIHESSNNSGKGLGTIVIEKSLKK